MTSVFKALASKLETPSASSQVATPNFAAFDPSTELWGDYWSRFSTFASAHSVPVGKKPQVFLTNQASIIYKMLSNFACQESLAKTVNELTMPEIVDYMKVQFDPKRSIVRERFKFWSERKRKPGESIQELASRLGQDAAACDFPSINDPLEEALQGRRQGEARGAAPQSTCLAPQSTSLLFWKQWFLCLISNFAPP